MDEAKAIAEKLPGVSQEQVLAVLDVLRAAKEGPKVGTVIRDPNSGDVAVRVDNGIPSWEVVTLNNERWSDREPTFVGWEQIAAPIE